MDLRSLSDRTLLENTEKLVRKERELTLEVLHHLREVERRSLYATLSYSSLFEYAVEELKYSEGSAQRRISSMRLLKELPELEKKIESGILNLSALSQAQVFFRQEKETIKTGEDKIRILETLENKSAREVQRELVSKSSQPEKLIAERVRAVSETYTEVKFLVEENTLKEIEELKALLSHKIPGGSIKEVLAYAVSLAVKNLKPKEPKVAAVVTCLKVTQSNTNTQKATSAKNPNNLPPTPAVNRYLPVEVKRQVWKRDLGQCTYSHNGKRCTSKHSLEFDHIVPFAVGGTNTMENLRLRCRTHNHLAAVMSFGHKKISQFVPRMR